MYSGVCNKHGKQEGFVAMILQPDTTWECNIKRTYQICDMSIHPYLH